MIAYAKNVDVSRLDAKLRKQRLGPWIRSLIGNAKQEWRIDYCHPRTGNPIYGADPSLCAQMHSRLDDGHELTVWIAIGSHKNGIKGPPTVWLVYFGVPGQELPALKLSDLPGLVRGVGGRKAL